MSKLLKENIAFFVGDTSSPRCSRGWTEGLQHLADFPSKNMFSGRCDFYLGMLLSRLLIIISCLGTYCLLPTAY